MILHRHRLWIGLRTATIAGAAMATSVGAQTKAQEHQGHAPKPGPAAPGMPNALAGPQAGEVYLTDGGPKDTRIRIYRDITLMRGHLWVGDELIRQERWDDAIVHFLHPAEELYNVMERYIKLHRVTPFDAELKAQAEAVKAQRKGAYEQSAKVVTQRLDDALAKFKTYMQPPITSFAVRTANEVFKVAAAEYEASIEDGKFVNPMEYQDARGFVLAAEMIYVDYSRNLEKINEARLGEIRGTVNELKAAFPSVMPPDSPAMTPADFSARVDRISELSTVFW